MLASSSMENDRIENAIAELRTEMLAGFATVNERFDGVNERFDGVDARFDGVEGRLGAVEGRLDSVATELEETRTHLTTLIESVRDDVRIFAEAHVALEQRVTTLEQRPR